MFIKFNFVKIQNILPPDPNTIKVLAEDETTYLFCLKSDAATSEITRPIVKPIMAANTKKNISLKPTRKIKTILQMD